MFSEVVVIFPWCWVYPRELKDFRGVVVRNFQGEWVIKLFCRYMGRLRFSKGVEIFQKLSFSHERMLGVSCMEFRTFPMGLYATIAK